MGGLRNDDPFALERAERETDPDEFRAILEQHSGKDATSCHACAIAQEYRVLRKGLTAECVELAALLEAAWDAIRSCMLDQREEDALSEALKPWPGDE
jgi:hypothetical protein